MSISGQQSRASRIGFTNIDKGRMADFDPRFEIISGTKVATLVARECPYEAAPKRKGGKARAHGHVISATGREATWLSSRLLLSALRDLAAASFEPCI